MGSGAGTRIPFSASGLIEDGEALTRLQIMWPAGSKCTILGLKSDAGQQLNGMKAEVQSVDKSSGRLVLRLQAEDDMSMWKKVKPENVQWEGMTLTQEPSSLDQEIRSLVRQFAGCPQAIDGSLVAELQMKLSQARKELPPDEFSAVQSFGEQARSHASQWLMYHELRMNPDIQFDQHGHLGPTDAKEKEVKDQMASVMKQAYWDVAREELSKPQPDFSFLLSRVEELVNTMAGFMPKAGQVAFKEGAVDMSMLRTQVDNNAFDCKSLMDLVSGLCVALMQLESPFQSARTKEWLQQVESSPPSDEASFRDSIVSCLAYLFDKCDTLRMDVENFGLQQIRATRLQELERATCLQMIRNDILGLDVTKSWLAACEHGGSVEVAVVKGIASLLVEKAALPLEKCPEPLRCDIQRLQNFQSGLQGAALLGLVAIIATPFFPVGTSVEDASPLFSAVAKETEKPHPRLELISKAVEDGIADLRHAKGEPPADYEKLDAALQTLKKCLGEDVPAFRLLHDRACKAFAAALGPPKRQLLPSSLGEAPWSLRYAVDHLNSLLERVWIFLGEHLRVYRSVYSEILSVTAIPTV